MQDITNGFNSFFSTIGPKLASEIPECNKSPFEYLERPNNETFSFCNVTPKILNDMLKI